MSCMAVVVCPYTLASLQCITTEHVGLSPTRWEGKKRDRGRGQGGKGDTIMQWIKTVSSLEYKTQQHTTNKLPRKGPPRNPARFLLLLLLVLLVSILLGCQCCWLSTLLLSKLLSFLYFEYVSLCGRPCC